MTNLPAVEPALFPAEIVLIRRDDADRTSLAEPLRLITNELNNGLQAVLGPIDLVLGRLERPEPIDENEKQACCRSLYTAQEAVKRVSKLMPQERRQRAQLPKPVPHVESRQATVLLVDDDRQVREFFRQALTDSGFAVVEAQGSFEAIRRCRSDEKFDVLITDVDMADMSGTELAKYLHLRRPDMRVILMSGAMPEELDPNAILLTKPFPAAVLVMALRDMLG